jgi:putative DNA primase/helicase
VSANMAAWAGRYCERFNFALTWSPAGEKGPRHTGWKLLDNAIRDPQAARRFWRRHPRYGIGVLLGYSGLVSLDVDHVEHSRSVLAHLGVDLDELGEAAPKIIGNPAKFRLMYRAPTIALSVRAIPALTHRTLSWPRQDEPRKRFAVFELRAGPVSDALPPTIHVGTQQPYRWAIPPKEGFPPLPAKLLELWTDWANTEKAALAVCPWYVAIIGSQRATQLRDPPRKPRDPSTPSVIAEFNAAHNVTSLLEAYGYERRGKRFSKPKTSHSAGLVLLDDSHVYCHHAGDVLGDGKPHDAFDVFVQLEHRGDIRAATRAAAQLLGLNERRRA